MCSYTNIPLGLLDLCLLHDAEMQSWPTEHCLCVRKLNVCEDKEGRWPGEVFISVSSYFKECPAFSSIAGMTLVIGLGDLDSPAVVGLLLI